MRVQMPEQHHAFGGEPRPRVAVALGHLVEHAARCGQRLAGDGVEVLEADRDPAERRRIPAREPVVGAGGRRPGVLLVDAYPGVDGVRIAVVAVRAVPLADAGQTGLDELARGESPPSKCRGRILHSEVGRIGHDAIISRPATERAAAAVRAGRR